MDEIFHGPQAREYCRGAFTTWHPKITTFPGIYYLGTLYGWARWAAQALVSPLQQLDAACDTPFLRSLNVLLSAACLLVLREILITYRQQTTPEGSDDDGAGAGEPRRRDRKLTPGTAAGVPSSSSSAAAAAAAASVSVGPSLHALLLALYPLHWFFSFLYYTDVASLLFLLLAQLQAARRRYLVAALVGALAVLCRQTNAVWAAFLLGEAALAEVDLDWAPALLLRRRQQGRQRFGSATEAADAAAPGADGADGASGGGGGDTSAVSGKDGGEGPVSELRLALYRLWGRRAALAARLWPLLLPPAGFAAFLAANGGSVVLGDKEAHKPVRHGAQLLYFGGWAALMLWPQLLPALGSLRAAAARRPLAAAGLAAVAVATAAAVAHVSTMVHPYMLADNRHYVFYLWRRVLGRSARAKFALAPAYAAAWALLLAALLRRVSWLWVGGFVACLVATLLPAWLLELRYFTPGLFLIALRMQPPSRSQAAAMLLMYGTINAVTMYLFLFRPYEFADGSVARFIW